MRTYLVITPFFPTQDSFRGAFVYDQVKAIQRTGLYGQIVIMRPRALWQKLEDYEYDGLMVHYFPTLMLPSNLLVGLFERINIRLFLSSVKRIGINIGDVVVAHAHVSMNGCYALAIKKKNPRIKALLQHHDPDPCSINLSKRFAECGWNTRLNSRYLQNIFERIDLHVCVSNKVKHNLLAFPKAGEEEVYPRYLHLLEQVKGLGNVKLKDTYVLYNGVDTQIFYPPEKKQKSDKFVIGCIANFLEWKDQLTLLRAIKRLLENGARNIEAILVGTGPMLEECKEFVSENKLDDYVTFLLEMKHEELRDFYQRLDLFVLSSYFEGFGCVFTEAYACGVPFMSCYHQGVSEIVEEPGKWLIEKGDDVQLTKLIVDYMDKRCSQKLRKPYDINILVTGFLKEISKTF